MHISKSQLYTYAKYIDSYMIFATSYSAAQITTQQCHTSRHNYKEFSGLLAEHFITVKTKCAYHTIGVIYETVGVWCNI